MKKLGLLAVAVFVASPALARDYRYYCDPSHAYYPDVTACSVAWREADAPQPPQPTSQAQTELDQARARAQAHRTEQEVKAKSTEKDVAAGYHVVSVEDFLLDGRDLANSEQKIELTGVYMRLGESDVLMRSPTEIAYARAAGRTPASVALLTDDAPREARRFLLKCQSSIFSQLGCGVTILGHVEMCVRTTALGTSNLPCVAVDDLREETEIAN